MCRKLPGSPPRTLTDPMADPVRYTPATVPEVGHVRAELIIKLRSFVGGLQTVEL